MKINRRIILIGLIAVVLGGILVGCDDSEQREEDEFLINYEENSDKRNKGLEFLKKHDSEYDRLNKKLGENRDFDSLTTTEQERYIKLVIQMLRLDIVDLSYNDEDKPVTKTTETSESIKEEIQNEQDEADRRKESLDPDGEIEKRLKKLEEVEEIEDEYLDETKAQKEAVEEAEKMFKYKPFSRTGLIHFLKYKEFTDEEAVYGVDNIGAGWVDNISADLDRYLNTSETETSYTSKEETENEYSDTSKTETMAQKNAVKVAKDWLDIKGFSRKRLIDRLEHDGFNVQDSTYAVDNITVDWNYQAEKVAQEWLDIKAFSRDRLIDRLEHDGFTNEEAIHGVTQVGY